MSEFGPWERQEGLDGWRKGTSFSGHEGDRRFRSCDFCGSIHPDDFMARVEAGWVVGPTDKNYKAYLGEPLTEDHHAVGKFYYQHLSAEQRARFVELLNAGKMRIGYPGHLYRLPFFVQRRAPAPAAEAST